jgi:hypothetical protein
MIEFAHSVPGRLRIRVPSIRHDECAAAEARAAVLLIRGVRDATLNRTTGSLVISYDPAKLSTASLWRELHARLALVAVPSMPTDDRSAGAPGWSQAAMKTAIDTLVGALVERSALALVRAIV